MAAVIPTMILSVNSMRSATFSIQQVRNLHKALHNQISMLGGLFIYAMAACIVVIIAVSVNWPTWKKFAPFSFLISFLLTFLVARAFAVIRGVRGLLQLAGELAEQEAVERAEKAKRIDELEKYEQPKDFGASLDLKH